MKIAFIGQKGIPATWGGVELHVDELSRRLRRRGHEVFVYVRSWYTPKGLKEYDGVRLIHLPTMKTKHLDATIHSFLSSLHALASNYDIVHYHAMGPTLFSWLPRLGRKRVVATIHRFDYRAEKWGGLAQRALKLSEWSALQIPHRTLVVARHLRDHYAEKGFETIYIPNGVTLSPQSLPQAISARYGLKGKDYLLFMGRLVPEKRVGWLIRAYEALESSELKLVIAGGSSATDQYVTELHRLARKAPDVLFTGYVTGQEKAELLSNAALFIIPSALEGLPIALLEAMSYQLPCLASDIPPHREVITEGENGYLFEAEDFDDLRGKMRTVCKEGRSSLEWVGQKALETVRKEYDWERITSQVEELYHSLLAGPTP